MSLRLVPEAGHASSTASTTQIRSTPSAPAVHDSLRSNAHQSLASSLNSRHPLQTRLQNWSATQRALKLESMRRVYGPAEPIRREMELLLCGQGLRHSGYAEDQGVGMDILRGTDTKLDVEDVFTGREFQNDGTFTEVAEGRMWSASK